MRFDITAGVKFKANGSQLMPHEVQQAERIILDNAAKKFGGATVRTGIGSYSNNEGTLVIEPVITVSISTAKHNADLVRQVAQLLKSLLSQESVLVEGFDSSSEFV